MKDQYLVDMRFAEELFMFLITDISELFEINAFWTPEFDALGLKTETDVSMFCAEVGMSVYHVIDDHMHEIQQCFCYLCDEMQKNGKKSLTANQLVDDSYFAACALKHAPIYFKEGYSHESFLGYCGMVLGVAFCFLETTPNLVPDHACQVIALVLFMHQMTGEFYEAGGWKGLHDVCMEFSTLMDAVG